MNGIKYYALDENEEVPYEFVVIRNVDGEPEFCASFVNTNSLAYGNGVLLKLHERNDELRAENTRLRSELESVGTASYLYGRSDLKAEIAKLRELLLDVADVLEEHTKLRELAERLRSAASDGTDNARDVFAENAKLRKLLLDVWNDAMQFDGFWDYVNDDGEIYDEDVLPHYQERMRELGIEVDG